MDDFNLNIVDTILFNNLIDTDEFKELCDAIAEASDIANNDLFLEAVSNPRRERKQKLSDMAYNAKKSTEQITVPFGFITDAGGSIMGAAWNLLMKCIGLICKLIYFIFGKIGSINNGINNVKTKIAKISLNTKAKIKGDITINITASDFEALYNNDVIVQLNTFISLGYELAQGDVWKTAFNIIRQNPATGLLHMSERDTKRCKEMEKIYQRIKLVEIHPTRVDMSDSKNIDIYFSNNKTIKFRDTQGVQHHSSYFDALMLLCDDINSRKDKLELLQSNLGQKLDKTQMNQAFNKISQFSRDRIINTIQMTSKVVSIVGDIVKCVSLDINTINKSCDVILSKQGIK